MFGAVVDAVRLLGSLITGARQLGDENRKKLAALCDQISNVMQRYIDASEDRRLSINLCAELEEYVVSLKLS